MARVGDDDVRLGTAAIMRRRAISRCALRTCCLMRGSPCICRSSSRHLLHRHLQTIAELDDLVGTSIAAIAASVIVSSAKALMTRVNICASAAARRPTQGPQNPGYAQRCRCPDGGEQNRQQQVLAQADHRSQRKQAAQPGDRIEPLQSGISETGANSQPRSTAVRQWQR